jgi:hypothetical protein
MDQKDLYTKWTGGSCPVDPAETVTVIQRCGLRVTALAQSQHWEHKGHTNDVVAYSVNNIEAIRDTSAVRIWEWVD